MRKPKNMTPEQEEAWKLKHSAHMAAWRANNAEKIRKDGKEYYQKNRERCLSYKRSVRLPVAELSEDEKTKRRAKERGYKKKTRAKNPDHYRQWMREYYAKYPEKFPSSLTKEERREYGKAWRREARPAYIAMLLGIPVADLPPEIMAAKKTTLLTKRILNQIKKHIDENTNE